MMAFVFWCMPRFIHHIMAKLTGYKPVKVFKLNPYEVINYEFMHVDNIELIKTGGIEND